MTPEFVTVPNVELIDVGEDWETSVGLVTFLIEDLTACIAAFDDPAVRTPVLKFGHVDPRFNTLDGQPSFGRVENLRITNNGMTLIGDYVGVPQWLAVAMPSMWPRRSIEGWFNYRSATGNQWDFVLTAVALLGETYPAIGTLEDLPIIAKATSVDEVPLARADDLVAAATEDTGVIRATKVGDLHMPNWKRQKKIAASVDVDQVRREFYDQLEADQFWWWIRAVQLEPDQLIVDDDEGGLYRVPFTVNGDTVGFDDPVPVKIQYVDTQQVAASRGNEFVVFASAQESRPPEFQEKVSDQGNKVNNKQTSGKVRVNDEEEPSVTDQQKELLGLPADASEEDVAARLSELVKLEPKIPDSPDNVPADSPDDHPAPEEDDPVTPSDPQGDDVKVPEGTVLVSEAELNDLRVAASRSNQLWEQERVRHRDALLDGAIQAGKFGPASRERFSNLYDIDPDGTRKTIEALASNVVPIVEIGHGAGEINKQDDAFPVSMLRGKKAGAR